MKLIDEYLENLYKKDGSEEVLELKKEMREHLIESVNELQLEGLGEEEACKAAIKRFDGGEEMQEELHTTIKELYTSLDQHKSIILTLPVHMDIMELTF